MTQQRPTQNLVEQEIKNKQGESGETSWMRDQLSLALN